MKIYRDEKYHLEIKIPDEWYLDKERLPILPSIIFLLTNGWIPNVEIAFHNGVDECLNIAIEAMMPEPTPEICEMVVKHVAKEGGYDHISFGRINVNGREHACVRYKYQERIWSKKYLIVLNGMGYAFTASCLDYDMFEKREPIWDSVVKSLRLL